MQRRPDAFYGWSANNGIWSWGDEIVLRSDARTCDFGYRRTVVRSDGTLVSIYYYTTEDLREQHIAATIWSPDERGELP